MLHARRGIGADGVRALAAALQHVPGLKELDVSTNRIGNDGARALAAALQRVPGLKELYVGGNSIGSVALAALRAVAAAVGPGLGVIV